LRSIKQKHVSWKVSISALAHWSKFANDFQGLADEITPMFYDLNPKRESLNGGLLPPLIDAATAEKLKFLRLSFPGQRHCPKTLTHQPAQVNEVTSVMKRSVY
jgi:hypothetical protein